MIARAAGVLLAPSLAFILRPPASSHKRPRGRPLRCRTPAHSGTNSGALGAGRAADVLVASSPCCPRGGLFTAALRRAAGLVFTLLRGSRAQLTASARPAAPPLEGIQTSGSLGALAASGHRPGQHGAPRRLGHPAGSETSCKGRQSLGGSSRLIGGSLGLKERESFGLQELRGTACLYRRPPWDPKGHARFGRGTHNLACRRHEFKRFCVPSASPLNPRPPVSPIAFQRLNPHPSS